MIIVSAQLAEVVSDQLASSAIRGIGASFFSTHTHPFPASNVNVRTSVQCFLAGNIPAFQGLFSFSCRLIVRFFEYLQA
jgi:hypothetical protein